jgi:DNA (cytosine-5)-methyltransferase 1
MKILNLYAGIGGNRKLWGDEHEITAVELNPSIAAIYKDFFPNDKMIITDAHQYLLDHFKEFDFIWSSPPCQSHSRLTLLHVNLGNNELKYPDMSLYQEIIILQNHFKGKFVIENVKGYYKPLINPQSSGRHYFWSNIIIPKIKHKKVNIKCGSMVELMNSLGINIFDWHGYNKPHKEQLLKNCVYPEIGQAILNKALKIQQSEQIEQGKLFNL